MRLISLTLKNFQGVKDFTVTPNGKDITIYGDNGTGKTTVFNAFTWLVFGKPSTGAKNFTPKTKARDGEAHGLDHTASAVFEHNGKRISLAKTFREIYKKKRGSIREEFDGHTTEHFVDGVPVKEKDYSAAVGDMLGESEELAKILTMPEYFSEVIPWENRRSILVDLCGDICDDDIFSGNADLSELRSELDGRSVEDMMKILRARRAEINKHLFDIPGRLDEANRAAEDVNGIDIESLQKSLEEIEDEKRILIEQRAIVANTATEEKRKELSLLEVSMSEAEASYRSSCAEKSADAREAVYAAKEKLSAIDNEIRRMKLEKSSAYERKEALERRRAELLDEYGKISSQVFDESATFCPCCHRPLPEEEIARLREDFNLNKSVRLSEINEKGKREASREMISLCDIDIKRISDDVATKSETRKEVVNEVQRAEQSLPEFPLFKDTEQYREIASKIAAVLSEIANEANTRAEALSAQDAKIRAVSETENGIRDTIARYNAAIRAKERVNDLLAEQKELAKEFEKAERLTYLCELFIKTKVSLLTDQINGRFENVRFSLFSEQINGGIKEECDVLIPSGDGALVPYAFANHAARINAGIEIIGTISKHYETEIPLFVDNAESITKIKSVSSQKILLSVSEKDKMLRSEVSC